MRQFLLPIGILALAPVLARAEPAAPPPGLILGRAGALGPVPSGPFWLAPPNAPGLAPMPPGPGPVPSPLGNPLRPAVAAGPGEMCRQAIAAAESAQGIPPNLLQAIGLVESGRPVAGSGRSLPWPWTVDFNGRGAFFPDKPTAIRAVAAAQAAGMRSIDVGCLQVNLMHHPHAFADLEQAFDPVANARYAAGFLHLLYDQTHDWQAAAAAYHSQTPALAGPYRARVMQAWAGLGGPKLVAGAGGVAFASPFAAVTPLALATPTAPMGGFRILRAAPTGGTAPPGRGLTSYRSRPIPIDRGG